MSCCNHWQSSTSDLRPETFLTWRALTSSTVKPRDSSRGDPVALGQALKVDCEAGELAHRVVVAIRWHSHEMRCAADVDGPGPRPPRRPATDVTQDHANLKFLLAKCEFSLSFKRLT